jgi:hypothetical protein
MRFASNRDSVRRGEVSVLAVIETIVATGISFSLAWHFGTIQHVVIASALAPLLLLRTRRSTWYAIWLVNRFEIGLFVLYVIPVAKLIANLYVTVGHPVAHLVPFRPISRRTSWRSI